MNSYGFGCKVIKQPVGRKSHDLILIWKGSFNETIDPKILHVQYKQYVSPTCGYIVTVKTFDERHWQQREGILKRRSYQKTLLEIHPFKLFLFNLQTPTKASICIEGNNQKTTHPETLTATFLHLNNGMVGIRSRFLFWGRFFLVSEFPEVDMASGPWLPCHLPLKPWQVWGGIGLGNNGSTWDDLGVSLNGGFSPIIIHFNRVFHYKPSILGYPYFWKHPFVVLFLAWYDDISGQNISLMTAQAEEKHTWDNTSIDHRYDGISNSFQSFVMGVDTCWSRHQPNRDLSSQSWRKRNWWRFQHVVAWGLDLIVQLCMHSVALFGRMK